MKGIKAKVPAAGKAAPKRARAKPAAAAEGEPPVRSSSPTARLVAAWSMAHGPAWVSAARVSDMAKEAIWPGGPPSRQRTAMLLERLSGPKGPLERMPASAVSGATCYRLREWVPPGPPPAPLAAAPGRGRDGPPRGAARIQRAALEASLASADLAGLAAADSQRLVQEMGGRDGVGLAAAAFEAAAALLRSHLCRPAP